MLSKRQGRSAGSINIVTPTHTTHKRPRSASSNPIKDGSASNSNATTTRRGRSKGLSNIAAPAPTAKKRGRHTSSILSINDNASSRSTPTNPDNTVHLSKKQKTNPKRAESVSASKVGNDKDTIATSPALANASTSKSKQSINKKQISKAVNGALSSTAPPIIDGEDSEMEDIIPSDSESEAEELEDDYDDDDEDVETGLSTTTRGSIRSWQLGPRLPNQRGLPKTVDYMWLVTTLVSTAVIHKEAKEGGKGRDKGKGKAVSIEEQEEEFVREVDECAPGHAGNTKAAYKSTYRPYMIFCDNKYADQGSKRYEVNDVKTARFLTEEIFEKSSSKNIPNHISKDTKVFMDRKLIQGYGIPITGKGIQGTFDLALYLKEKEKEAGNSMTQKDTNGSTKQIKDGRTKPVKIFVPYGVSRVNQAYSALIHLWTLQTTRLQQKSSAPPIRPSVLIDKAIENYKRSLVGGILKAEHVQRDADGNIIRIGRDVTTDSYATNYYSIYEHIRILLYTWQQSVTARSAGMREHFILAVRHAMLLRDEDLRRLNIANCTIDTLEQQLGGTQPIMAMVFSIHGGKTNQHGYRQEGIAIRHRDFRRCSVGALAFYMYERFQLRKERWPDMMNDEGWTGVKLLSTGAGSDKYAEISYPTNRSTTMEVFIANNISCSNITHSGRHSGAKEGVRLNIPEEDIRVGGRWIQNTGKMQQYYLQKRPTQWALAIAGFRNRPFHLERNEVDPSHQLQRLIFPFIESVIGAPKSERNKAWLKECEKEMDQFDPNNSKELEIVKPVPVASLPDLEGSRRPTVFRARSNVTFVLRLMLRLRRVLLQDAAVYLFVGEKQGFRSPLLETPKSVFQDPLFISFKRDVVQALELSLTKVPLPLNLPDNMMLALEVSNSNQSNNMQTLKNMWAKTDDKFGQMFLQITWANDMLGNLARSNISLERQMYVLQERMQSQQEAIDSMSRHQRVSGSLMPGYSGYFGYPGYSGFSAPGPFSQQGPSVSNRPTIQKHKHARSAKDHVPVAIQPSLPRSALQSLSVPVPATAAASPSPSSALEDLLRTRSRATGPISPIDTYGAGSGISQAADTGSNSPSQSSPPSPTPDREDWFDIVKDHSSTASVYEEHQRYERALNEKLGKNQDGAKRPRRLEKRQSYTIEKHTSNCSIVASEVDLLKQKKMQAGLSEDKALAAACLELDGLIRMSSARGGYTLNLARDFCAKQRKERNEMEKQGQVGLST